MQENSKRIAKNTIFLYLRMIVIMAVTLYTSRVILSGLGVSDFGLYNAVGGFVAMFSLISGSLSNAISRYLTFELGRGDVIKLKVVFSSSVTVQIILAIFVLIISEIIGVWFLNVKMNIPDGRMVAANWVFQCSLVSFVLSIIAVPYNASLIAHEDMRAYAYISIIEILLKLLVAYSISFFLQDKLIIYAILLVLVSVIIQLVYLVYCKLKFEECYYNFQYNSNLIKEMLKLASWNLLGSSGAILNSHGINLLMNLFFGVSVNAARGLATQVNAAVTQFVSSFTAAVNPQITKSYAKSETDYMFRLVFLSSKFSFFLMLLVSLPLFIQTPYILKLWLGEVPEFTVLFVRLTLVAALMSTLTTSLYTLALATGDIKKYQIVIGSLSLSCFFITYVLYYIGFSVEYAYYANIFIQICVLFARLKILSDLTGLDIIHFIKKVLLRSVLVSLVLSMIIFPASNYIYNDSFVIFTIVVLLGLLVSCIIIFLFGLNSDERKFAFSILYKYKSRLL